MTRITAWLREYRLFVQFTAISFFAFIAVAALVISSIPFAIEDFFVTDAERQAVVAANRFAHLTIPPEAIRAPKTEYANRAFEDFLRILPIRGIVAANIVGSNGIVWHTTAPRSPFGMRNFSGDELFRSAAHLEGSARFISLSPSEQASLGVVEAVIQYLPVTFGDEREASFVLVALSRTGFVREAIAHTERRVAGRIIAGLAGLYAVLAFIVWGAARTIVRQTKALADGLTREKELSTIKDQFISTASHQLNTPISVMGWSLELLNEHAPQTDDAARATQNIRKAFEDLRAIVSSLLTVSDIGFHYEPKRAVPLDIAALTRDAIGRAAIAARARNIAVQLEAPANPVLLTADAFALTKVLDRLIDNAVQYADSGTEVVARVSRTGRAVEWRVRNKGIGIPPEEQPFIFEKMFRAKNAVERKNVGSGLSLFIAKRVIEGHGGTLRFASMPGGMTEFWFTIPDRRVS